MILGLFLILLLFFVVFPVVGMALWAILTTLVVGLVIGAVARLVVPGPQRISLTATILAGWCGGIVGGFLGDHVLHVGGLGTVLLEIGVAAAAVALMAGDRGRRLSRLR